MLFRWVFFKVLQKQYGNSLFSRGKGNSRLMSLFQYLQHNRLTVPSFSLTITVFPLFRERTLIMNAIFGPFLTPPPPLYAFWLQLAYPPLEVWTHFLTPPPFQMIMWCGYSFWSSLKVLLNVFFMCFKHNSQFLSETFLSTAWPYLCMFYNAN